MKFNNLVKSLMENFGEQYADGVYSDKNSISSHYVLEVSEIEFEFQAPIRGRLEDFTGIADVDYGMDYDPGQDGGYDDPSWGPSWNAEEENITHMEIYTTDEQGNNTIVTPSTVGGVKEFLELVKIAVKAMNERTQDQIESYDGDGSDEPDHNDRDTDRDEPREWAGME